MTVAEAHIAFKVETDKNAINIGISGCPSFLPEEIDYWLYTALLSKLATKFTGHNTIQVPFEGAVKRVSDLEGLIRTDKDVSITQGDYNSLVIEDYSDNGNRMYYVSALLHFGNTTSIVRLTTHEVADKYRKTYNNHPWIEVPVGILENGRLEVLIDPDLMPNPYSIDLTYIKKPTVISYTMTGDCMEGIPEYMQYEIIKLAADMAIENIESPRSQTHPQYVTQLSE